VSAEANGFAKKTVDNILISGDTMQSLNIALEAEGATQSVTVTDITPSINTSTATISGTISAKEMQALPSSNRDPYQLLRLAPGSLGDGSQSAGGGSYSLPGNGGIGGSSSTGSIFQVENRAQTQGNGVRTSGNSFQIDGSQVNSLAWGGGAVITPNQESVKRRPELTMQPTDEIAGPRFPSSPKTVPMTFMAAHSSNFTGQGLMRINATTDQTHRFSATTIGSTNWGAVLVVPSGRTTSSFSSRMKSCATAPRHKVSTGMKLLLTTNW
jgi:hypothetical protein